MRTVVECDPAGLAQRAGPWLEAEPVLHNVVCTVLARAREDPARFPDAGWFVVEEESQPVGVAIITPPFPLGLTPMSGAALATLVDAVARGRPRLSGVTGPGDTATHFCALWQERTGAAVREGMAQCIYRLDCVAPLALASGRLRPAGEDDRALLRQWAAAFAAEVGTPDGTDDIVDRWLHQGEMHLWDDGRVVSMAGASAAVAGVVRIRAVYSPSEVRGRGYATSCVASVSQRSLDGGATACMLYADKANPTSNAIYQRIGYRPVSESRGYRFTYG
jgi:RimJ/RimL family protein N-acetyltransferase